MLGVSSEYTEDFNCGPISVTKKQTQDPSGRSLSLMLLTLLVSSSRKLLLRLNNLTPVLESALEFNSRKTTRELPPTFQEMVVCLSLKKMTRFLLLVSVDLDTLRVISRVLDSRSSKLLDAVSVPFGNIRRISHKNERTGLESLCVP